MRMPRDDSHDSLSVFLHGEKVGEVRRPVRDADFYGAGGAPMRITQDVPTPLSLSLRGSTPDPYSVLNWMDGLLPDDPTVRGWWANQYEVPATSFSLLATEIGYDCAGAVQFAVSDHEDELMARPSGTTALDEAALAERLRHIQRMGRSGRGAEAHGLRFPQRSLGGWQPKIGMCRETDVWHEPYGNTPSTHIIKLPPRDYPGDCVIEVICQGAAHHLGLPAARCAVLHVEDMEAIVYLRFDRELTIEGDIRRVHYEDGVQALGQPPGRKYQSFSGPTPARIIQLLREHAPLAEREVEAFVDALVFNHLIGGIDAHAKNFGVRLEGGFVALAPLYDTSSSLPWAEGSDRDAADALRPAMWPCGTGRGARVQPSLRDLDEPEPWRLFAEANQLDARRLLSRMHEMADGLVDAFGASVESLPVACQESWEVQSLMRRIRGRALVGASVGA